MRRIKTVGAALGLGFLFAWMESVFLVYGLSGRLAAAGLRDGLPLSVFFAAHSLAYLFLGALPLFGVTGRSGNLPSWIGAGLLLSLPFLVMAAESLPSLFSFPVSLAAAAFPATGAAVLMGKLGVLLSTMTPHAVTMVFGLSPLAASLILNLASAADSSLLLFSVPPALLAILLRLGRDGNEEEAGHTPLLHLPIWRLVLFLFCFYAANGFLLSLMPALFPQSLPRAEQVTDWIRTLAAISVASAFRISPGSDLRTFYRGTFPFIAAALFLLNFTSFREASFFFLEGGLAILDLYAWLLLICFASRTGRMRGTVVNWGLFVITVAEVVSHFHLFREKGTLFPGEVNMASFVLLGIFLLLVLLSLWDGREVPWLWKGSDPDPEKVPGEDPGSSKAAAAPPGLPPKACVPWDDRETEFRLKLLERGLTRQETEITLLLLRGLRDMSICSLLYISRNTLKYHLRNIYRKTGSGNRRELRASLGFQKEG